MNSSVKIMKATGVVYIIHGIIVGLLMAFINILSFTIFTFLSNLLLWAVAIGLSFFYIYIGYELFSFRSAEKTRNILIASIILSGLEVFLAAMKGHVAGIIFIVELILSIIAICNINSYRKLKKRVSEKKNKD